jgi:hypothetical protein
MVSVSLLEVIGEDLLMVDRIVLGDALQPKSEAFVKMGPELFRNGPVGGVPESPWI